MVPSQTDGVFPLTDHSFLTVLVFLRDNVPVLRKLYHDELLILRVGYRST